VVGTAKTTSLYSYGCLLVSAVCVDQCQSGYLFLCTLIYYTLRENDSQRIMKIVSLCIYFNINFRVSIARHAMIIICTDVNIVDFNRKKIKIHYLILPVPRYTRSYLLHHKLTMYILSSSAFYYY